MIFIYIFLGVIIYIAIGLFTYKVYSDPNDSESQITSLMFTSVFWPLTWILVVPIGFILAQI